MGWYHLAEHVHKAAAVFGKSSAGGKAWAEARKADLWEGWVPEALQAVQAEAARVRSPTKRAAVHELRTCLEINRGRVDYLRYRELGLRCGSGQVEAQCKTLVGRGASWGTRNWTYAGAEGVLRLRAALQEVSDTELWRRRLQTAP